MSRGVTESTYFERSYRGPYQGINVTSPETDIPPQATPFCDNVYIRNNELRTFPHLTKKVLAPAGVTDIRAIAWFKSYPQFPPNLTRTVVLTPQGLYSLMPLWRVAANEAERWQKVIDTSATLIDDKFPYPNIASLGSIYWCEADGNIYTWDGISDDGATKVVGAEVITLAGTSSSIASGRFMFELDAHLILAYTQEKIGGILTTFPQRIRWSASGRFDQFDPTLNIGAGLNDMIDIPDEITGVMPLGRSAYIFRQNGITEMYPIGGSFAPWGFNHLWAAQNGVGNAYVGSEASFGSLGIFISQEDAYMMTGGSFNNIGGTAFPEISKDLEAGYYIDHPLSASIIPGFVRGVPHSLYVLAIPQGNANSGTRGSIIWFYDVKNNLWFKHTTTITHISAPAVEAPLGDPAVDIMADPPPGVEFWIASLEYKDINVLFPFHDTQANEKYIGIFDANNNNCKVASTYKYKVEEIAEGKFPTIHRIRIRYRDLGPCPVTITLEGFNGTDAQTASQDVIVGTALKDNKIKTAYVDMVFTAESPQLIWSVGANAGPLSIIGMSLIGNMGDGKQL